jgi:preprotein translocase subunit SecE
MTTGNDASSQAIRSGLDPLRLVVIFYLVAAIILGMFLDRMLDKLFTAAGWRVTADLIPGIGWSTTAVLGIVLGVAIAIGCYLHPRTKQLSQEVASELMKVTWPSWSETRVSTIAVVVASLIAAVILFGIDTLSYQVMVDWLPKVWGNL